MQILPGLEEIPVSERAQQKTEKKNNSDMFSLLLGEPETEKTDTKQKQAGRPPKAEKISSLSEDARLQRKEDSGKGKKSDSGEEHLVTQIESFLLSLVELRSLRKGKQVQNKLHLNELHQDMLGEFKNFLEKNGVDSSKTKALLADLFLGKEVLNKTVKKSSTGHGQGDKNLVELEDILAAIRKRWENALSKIGLSSEKAKELSTRIEKDLRDLRYPQSFVREEKAFNDISYGNLGQKDFSFFQQGGNLLSDQSCKMDQNQVLSETKRFELPVHSVARQIEQAVLQDLRPGRRQLVLRLEPAALGAVMVMLRIKEKDVHAVLRASSHEAARVISEQTQQLRQSLESQGFRVARLDVEQDFSTHPDPGFGAWQQRKQQEGGEVGWKRRLSGQFLSGNESDEKLSALLEHELHSRAYRENFSSGVDIFA